MRYERLLENSIFSLHQKNFFSLPFLFFESSSEAGPRYIELHICPLDEILALKNQKKHILLLFYNCKAQGKCSI